MRRFLTWSGAAIAVCAVGAMAVAVAYIADMAEATAAGQYPPQ